MAVNLVQAGYPVSVWNRSADKAAALENKGARVATSAAEAVEGARYVIFMLSTGPVVDEVLFGADSVEAALAKDACVIVMSSIPVETARQQATRLAERGVTYIDAPVSGGEKGAIEATLTIMAGGEEAVLSAAKPILEALGRVTHVGPVGSGQLAKLSNQLIVGITIDAVAEALLLAEAGGADPAAVRDALLGGFADSTILQQHGERMLKRNFEPGGRAELQLKDLRTCSALAADLGLDLPVLRQVEDLYREMCESGRADLDHSALYLALRDRSP